MIITCPECDTRFVVPSTIFAKGGRKMRCASCKHQWFQENPNDVSAVDEDISEDDIVRRSVEKDEKKKPSSSNGFTSAIQDDFRHGYGTILIAFLLIVLGFYIFKWMTPELIVGEGLAFDGVEISREDNVINLTGQIINVMNDKRGIPRIRITQILESDMEGDSRIFNIDKDILLSGEAVPFSFTLNDIGNEVKDLKITFQNQSEGG